MKHLFFILISLALSIGMEGVDYPLCNDQKDGGKNHEG